MNRLAKALSSLAIIAVSMAVATTSWAYWTTAGAGTGSASVGTLNAPGQPAGTTSIGTVALQWTAATRVPAGSIDGYYVQRTKGASTADACNTVSAAPRTLIQTLGCTDTNLQAGTYTYTVTAVYRSWTAKSVASTPIPVSTVSPATKLVLAAASANPTAGAANNLTITAQDAGGNTATSYTGDKDLTFGGALTIGANKPTVTNKTGTAVEFGQPTKVAFTNGVATVNGANNGVLRLYKAGPASVSVSDGTISNGTGLALFVNSAGAPLSFTDPVPSGKFLSGNGRTWTDSVTIGADPYGNAAQYASPGLTLTIMVTDGDVSHFSVTDPSNGSFQTTGSPSPTFTVVHTSAASKTATLTVSGPAGGGFTPVSGTLSS